MNSLALELIKYQNKDDFPKRLTLIISNIYRDIDNEVYTSNKDVMNKSPYIKEIEKLIKSRFNLNIILDKELSEYLPASILPFMKDHLLEFNSLNNFTVNILSNLFNGTNIYKHIKEIEKEKEEYFKRIHNRKGFVDIKLARVGGYLSDVKSYLILNFITLKNEGLTPEEVTAVILHEIGHVFSGLESHHKLNTTNSTMLDILSDINNNKVDKAYYTFRKKFEVKEVIESSLGNKNEIYDFYGKLANRYISELSSQFADNKYDETNYENLADSFSTRFGVGKDLVSGLNKLHIKYGKVLENSRIVYVSMFILEVLIITLFLALTGVIGIAISAYAIVAIFGISKSDMTYDFPIERYIRVRNNIVNNLKDKSLPSAITRDLLEQYEYINLVIEKSMHMSNILPTISDYIIPSNRNSLYYKSIQRKIEDNLSSILFVKSAQLSVI